MLSVIFGLASIVIGVLWVAMWGAWDEFLMVLQGAVPPFMILVGLVAVAAGISSIKDNMAAKKEEEEFEKEGSQESAPAAAEPSAGSEEPAASEEEQQ